MGEKEGNFALAYGGTLVLQAQQVARAHLIGGFSLACTYLPLFSEGWLHATCLFDLLFPSLLLLLVIQKYFNKYEPNKLPSRHGEGNNKKIKDL